MVYEGLNKGIKYVTLLLIAVVMASCAKDTAFTEIEEPIRFTIKTEKAETKGTPILGTGFPSGGTFTIYGYNKTGGTYSALMQNRSATASGSAVTLTGGPYYWPLSSEATLFYAFYPQTTTGLSVTNDVSTPNMGITYTVPTSFAQQQDILYVRKTDAEYQQNVELVFKHLLTRVTFQCRLIGNDTNAEVKVSSVALNNAISTGTFTLTPGGEAWSNNTATANYSVSLGDNAKVIGSSFDQTADTHEDGDATTNNYTNIFKDGVTDNSFLMIPASVSSLNAMTLVFTVMINGTERSFTIDDVGDKTESMIGTGKGWEQGKHINYRLVLDMGKEIPAMQISSVSIESWGAKQDIDLGIEI